MLAFRGVGLGLARHEHGDLATVGQSCFHHVAGDHAGLEVAGADVEHPSRLGSVRIDGHDRELLRGGIDQRRLPDRINRADGQAVELVRLHGGKPLQLLFETFFAFAVGRTDVDVRTAFCGSSLGPGNAKLPIWIRATGQEQVVARCIGLGDLRIGAWGSLYVPPNRNGRDDHGDPHNGPDCRVHGLFLVLWGEILQVVLVGATHSTPRRSLWFLGWNRMACPPPGANRSVNTVFAVTSAFVDFVSRRIRFPVGVISVAINFGHICAIPVEKTRAAFPACGQLRR